MASGWNLWVWLVSVVVRRYFIDILIIIITFPYSTCISSFFGSIIPISLFFFIMFFRSFIIIMHETTHEYHYVHTLHHTGQPVRIRCCNVIIHEGLEVLKISKTFQAVESLQVVGHSVTTTSTAKCLGVWWESLSVNENINGQSWCLPRRAKSTF